MTTILYGVFHPRAPQECLYVGITSGLLHVRQNAHWNAALTGKTNGPFPNWMRTYRGERDVVEFIALHEYPTREEALEAEVALIAGLRIIGQARLNQADGGEGQTPGFKHSDESKRKMSYPGEKNPGAKLTWAGVRDMRARASKEYVPVARLATEFGVAQTLIRRVLAGEAWTDETYDPSGWVPKFRMTPMEDITRIRELRAEGARTRELARMFNVSESTVRTAIRGTSRPDDTYDPATQKPLPPPGARLTEDEVREIRNLREAGVSVKIISEKFAVSETNVYYIANRKIWADVE